MIELHFIEGENAGVKIRIPPEQEIVIGRSQKCDVCLSERKISRKHAKIQDKQEGHILLDLGSTNGTYLNGQRVEQAVPLKAGDMLRIGTSVINIAVSEGGAEEIKELEINSMASSAAVEEAPVEVSSSKKPLSGNLTQMPLPDLLQTLANSQRSGHVLLTGTEQGEIIIKEGTVIGARAGKVRGEKAFYRLLSWENADFEFASDEADEIQADDEEKIEMTVESLLLEGFRQLDEIARIIDKAPAIDAEITLNAEMPAKLSKLHPRVLDMVQLIIAKNRVKDILDSSKLSDLDSWKVLAYLKSKEYISEKN